MDKPGAKKHILFILLELAWGALFALFLQHTRPGKYLAYRKSWLAVVIGVIGTEILSLPVTGTRAVLLSALAFSCSAIGIVARALVNERHLEEVLHAEKST